MSRVAALRKNSLVELVFIVAIAIFLALAVQAYAVKPYRIPSGSMEPTLDVGERVLVQRVTTRLGAEPKVGDIIVFHPPAGADGVPARSAAPPPVTSSRARGRRRTTPTRPSSSASSPPAGTRSRSRDGLAIVNGRAQPAPFAAPCAGGDGCDMTQPITVPKGSVFLMGDNRGNSDDSRYWGPVPDDWVIGKAFATYWPPSRIGIR